MATQMAQVQRTRGKWLKFVGRLYFADKYLLRLAIKSQFDLIPFSCNVLESLLGNGTGWGIPLGLRVGVVTGQGAGHNVGHP